MRKLLTIISLLCAIASTGCISVKKTYEYDPPPQVWKVNYKTVAVMTPQEQQVFQRIVK